MTDFFKEINEFIKQSLAETYSRHSFQAQEKFNGFFKKAPGIANEVFIGPNAEFESRINYQPDLRVRNDELDATKKRLLGSHEVFGGTLLFRYQGGFLAKEFGVDGYDGWIDYKVRNKSDAIMMIDHHNEFMNKAGWKFFETTSTLEGINRFLNAPFLAEPGNNLTEDEKVKLIRMRGIGGMVNGIVAAFIVKDKELEKLISHYRTIYFPDHIQNTLNILVEGMESF